LISYVASHDLQAPLRLLLRNCEELATHPVLASDETMLNTVHTVSDQATRMKLLLDGLLEYIRLETFVVKHTPLDSGEILTVALTALETEIKNSGSAVTCDNLPPVLGHRGRLTRLFVHIIDNAIKFRGKISPKIHISARRTGNQWEFCIEDNGIGIDKDYHDVIFTLFQRLHTEDTYPGIGAGLALSRKIVESHGGKLWVESVPGKGARFLFTFPAI
jgi:chemotaxis family two-component system sensor kinase Cph1